MIEAVGNCMAAVWRGEKNPSVVAVAMLGWLICLVVGLSAVSWIIELVATFYGVTCEGFVIRGTCIDFR